MKTGRTAIAFAVLLVASGIIAFCQTTWISTVVDPIGGATISPEGTMVPYGDGGTLTFVITPSGGWSFETVEIWKQGHSQPDVMWYAYGPGERTITWDFGSGVYEIRAYMRSGTWYPLHTYTVGPGTVMRYPENPILPADCGFYEVGDQVVLDPVFDPGCVFLHWGWDAFSTDDPLIVTVPDAWSWIDYRAFFADATPPEVHFAEVPAKYSNDTTPLIAWEGTDNVTPSANLEYTTLFDGAPFSGPDGRTSVELGPLAEGPHGFLVDARDEGYPGVSEIEHLWIVDLTPPNAHFENVPAVVGPDPNPAFAWSGYDDHTQLEGLLFSTKLDGGGWSSPDHTFSCVIGPLADGSHTFQVRAVDEAGNVGSGDSYVWEVAPEPAVQTWISTVVDPIGGASISPEEDGGNAGTYSFTIAPSSGWSLDTVEVYWASDASQPLQLNQTKYWYGTQQRVLSRVFGPGVFEIRVHARAGSWYVVGAEVVGPGSVTLSPEGEPLPVFGPDYFLYEDGTEITLTATHDPWCTFAGWDDDAEWTSTENPLVITVSGSGWAAYAKFEEGPPPLTITASAGPGGTIEPAGAVLVASGDSQTFTITPDPNYTIADVQVDDASVDAVETYTFMAVDADHTIAATFNPVQTWISTVVDPIGGASISPEEDGGNAGTYSFTIAPSSGWSLDTVEVYWASDASQPLQLNQTKYWYGTQQRVLSRVFGPGVFEIRVHARAGSWYVVGAEVVGPGSVTLSPEGEPLPVFGPDYFLYEDGTEITLTALPDPSCVFVGWDDDAGWTSAENPLVITVAGSGWAAYAKFAPLLTITASAGPGGSIDPAGEVEVVPGDDQTFTITPDPGYAIVDVLVDGGTVGAVGAYTFTAVDGDHAIEATFNPLEVWITTVVNPLGGASISPEEDGGNAGTYSFTIAPSPGWSLNTVEVYWASDASQPLQLNQTKYWYGTRQRVLSRVFGPGVFEIRVHARAGSWYVVGAEVLGPGSVSLSPEGEPLPVFGPDYFLYEDGTEITLTAAPDAGCFFSGWNDDAGWSSTENPLVITVAGGGWAAIAGFLTDVTPPEDPIVASPSHEAGVWSNDANVVIGVVGAADVETGVDGYEVAWDKSATWAPSHTKGYEETWPGGVFPATTDGMWYFHLATVDNAGNWTETVHLGPLNIDTTPPQLVGCPEDLVWYAPPDATTASVYWTPPGIADNLDPYPALVGSATPGQSLPLGSTDVAYSAADWAGNWASCEFSVTVLEQIPPATVTERMQLLLAGTGYGVAEAAVIVNTANQAMADGAPPGAARLLVSRLVDAGTPFETFVGLLRQFDDLIKGGVPIGLAINMILGK